MKNGRHDVMKRITAMGQRERAAQNLPSLAITTRRDRDEAGAILILALVFLLAIGLIAGGLATWVSADLQNTLSFQNDRNVQYTLSSTTQVAIQNIRYTPLFATTLNAVQHPSYCWGSGPSSYLTFGPNEGNETVAAFCSTTWNPSSSSTRVVTVSACIESVSALNDPAQLTNLATACAANPGLQTVVTFDDYSSSNPTANPGFCLTPPNGTCGYGMTMNSSSSNTTNPTVTALSSTQGPLTGGGTLTVTGTGFVSNATATNTTVNFVSTNAAANIVLPGTGVNVTSPTSLTVAIPPATVLGGYYVVVSTPNGSSAAVNASQYTYQNVIPTVTSIATPATNGTCPTSSCGSAAGGTALTISGTGFLSNPSNATTVNFIDTANAAVVVPATYLTVNNYFNGVQTITVTTPSITQDSTYYVTVTTAPGGTSTEGPIFTFEPLTPVVASISPTTSGPRTVTITGIGFVSGATTVQLVPTTGSTLTATGVTVTSSTTLTATIPSGGTTGRIYNVEVTTTTGGASGTSGVPQYTY